MITHKYIERHRIESLLLLLKRIKNKVTVWIGLMKGYREQKKISLVILDLSQDPLSE